MSLLTFLKALAVTRKRGRENEKQEHRVRCIGYWDIENGRLFEIISNNYELTAKKIALIYKRRWQIELLFKQLKQNFPLKYFAGDNENAIEMQIWATLMSNLLITIYSNLQNICFTFTWL